MKIAVVGGGPAGMNAAIHAAAAGTAEVTLFEKNEKLGKKLYITGKGRCNVTNSALPSEFLNSVISNPKFCYGALNKFSSADAVSFFNSLNVPLKTERGGRIFPVSDKSSDIIGAFQKSLESNRVCVRLNSTVKTIEKNGTGFKLCSGNNAEFFDKVILACGGLSYPATGSTGDGFVFAHAFGHTLIETKPSLCPILLKPDVRGLEGLSLKNVSLKAVVGGKVFDAGQGEMLFTADGISGPLVLTLSAMINRLDLSNAYLTVDLKPALEHDELDRRVLRDFSEFSNKDFSNALDKLLPKRLIFDIINRSGIPQKKKINMVTAEERARLVGVLKDLRFEILGLADIKLAVVTAGGVSVREINPATMESKLIKGLFFAGEMIDIDAKTGGFNIQLAMSTGYLAGVSALKE